MCPFEQILQKKQDFPENTQYIVETQNFIYQWRGGGKLP